MDHKSVVTFSMGPPGEWTLFGIFQVLLTAAVGLLISLTFLMNRQDGSRRFPRQIFKALAVVCTVCLVLAAMYDTDQPSQFFWDNLVIPLLCWGILTVWLFLWKQIYNFVRDLLPMALASLVGAYCLNYFVPRPDGLNATSLDQSENENEDGTKTLGTMGQGKNSTFFFGLLEEQLLSLEDFLFLLCVCLALVFWVFRKKNKIGKTPAEILSTVLAMVLSCLFVAKMYHCFDLAVPPTPLKFVLVMLVFVGILAVLDGLLLLLTPQNGDKIVRFIAFVAIMLAYFSFSSSIIPIPNEDSIASYRKKALEESNRRRNMTLSLGPLGIWSVQQLLLCLELVNVPLVLYNFVPKIRRWLKLNAGMEFAVTSFSLAFNVSLSVAYVYQTNEINEWVARFLPNHLFAWFVLLILFVWFATRFSERRDTIGKIKKHIAYFFVTLALTCYICGLTITLLEKYAGPKKDLKSPVEPVHFQNNTYDYKTRRITVPVSTHARPAF